MSRKRPRGGGFRETGGVTIQAFVAPREGMMQVDGIKRTTGPRTTNGKWWEVQLSAVPTPDWLELFKVSGESSAKAVPQRVDFDRDSAAFKSDEGQVEHWVASIDKWIASTNVRYLMTVEHAQRARSERGEAEAKERERIQRLNDRFKDL